MKILNKVTWKVMWQNRVRTLVTIAGIILSAAMFTAVTTLGVSALNYLIESTVYDSGDYFLRFDYSNDEQKALAAQIDEVTKFGTMSALGYTTLECADERGDLSETYVVAAGDDNFFDMIPLHLEEGRLPENGEEIVITRNAYYYLQTAGLPCEIGSTVTLDVFPDYIPEEGDIDLGLPDKGEAFTKSYQIVGITEHFTYLEDHSLNRSHLFTKADGAQTAAWHRLYLKTNPPKAVYTLQNRQLGMVHGLNSELLALYGASKYTNYNHFLYTICGVLMVIILVGSVSLIYNAFSISVSERTKQFGLFSSVGATKRQIRRSVYFEALALSGLAIPLGIALGYWGIAVTLYLTKDLLSGMLPATDAGYAVLRAIPSLPAFVCAGLVTLLTAFLSACIPARRATKVSPIAAIRQAQDYKIPKKLPRGKRSTFGFPGIMARKYYQVSKSKYRATVVSLSITMVLFLAASGFSGVLQSTADEAANATGFDIICYQMTGEQIEQVRNLPGVEKSMLQHQRSYMTMIDDAACTEEYRAIWEGEKDHRFKYLYLVYMEDEAFAALLRENGLDEKTGSQGKIPTGLISDARIYQYSPGEDGGINLYTYEAPLLKDSVDTIPVYSAEWPSAVWNYATGHLGSDIMVEPDTVNGNPVWIFKSVQLHYGSGIASPDADTPRVYVTMLQTRDDDGNTVCAYHPYDPETDRISEEAICTEILKDVPEFCIITGISDWPYGTVDNLSFGGRQISLWLPLSAAGDVAPEKLELVLDTSNHQSVLTFLDEQGILYTDYRSDEMYQRNLKTMVDVFSYGFIILISLICVCNIFNTISTNIALRRRDFGMLRSIGMESRALNRMLELECLRYGCISALWGLPLGLAAHYCIYRLTTSSLSNQPYVLPLGAIGLTLGCAFSVVFASAAYTLSKLKRDNPIDAIRMDYI